MAVLAADVGALVEPLAVVQEGEVAGSPVRVALDGVDPWGGSGGERSVMPGCVCVYVLSRTSKYTVETEDDVTVTAPGRQQGESTFRINTLLFYFCLVSVGELKSAL